MYIRHQGDALEALAQILELPERRQQIVQATIKIMLCLDAEPRAFLGDCQALLIEGGLDDLRRKRHETLVTQDSVPILILDPEGDRLFEEAASAVDALRLTQVVRQIFPDLRHERWTIARGLLAHETDLRAQLEAAVKARGQKDVLRCARGSIDSILASVRPSWADRAGTLRTACLDVLRGGGLVEADLVHEEADQLFELFAVSDARAEALLAAIDRAPEEAVSQIVHLYEALDSVRSLATGASSSPSAQDREAA